MEYNAFRILKKINNHGYEAYLVGGCVRDKELGVVPHDFDITTNMPMEDIKELFHTIDVGEQYGVLMIRENGYEYEIAQYRNEVYRDNSRNPIVTFGATLIEDLQRRDFTINAIAMDYDGKKYYDSNLYDPYKDMKDKILRFVGDTLTRIKEDPLRILRAFRFAARYKFLIPKEDLKIIQENKELLNNIPVERIKDELNKGIMLDNVDVYFKSMMKTQVLSVFMPELQRIYKYEQKNSHHEYTLDTHTLLGVKRSTRNLKVRWAVLLHDIGKPDTAEDKDGKLTFHGHQTVGSEMAEVIMKRLKFSTDLIRFVTCAIERHMSTFDSFKNSGLNKLLNIFGEDLPLFIQVKIGDYYGHDFSFSMIKRINRMLYLNDRVFQMVFNMVKEYTSFSRSKMTVNGDTLIELGYTPGPVFSEILEDIFKKVIDEELENSEEVLSEYILNNYDL